MTTPIELLQSRKPGAPGCFLVLRNNSGTFTISSPTTEIPVQVTNFNDKGEITQRNINCIANNPYLGSCYFTNNKGNSKKISGTVTIMGVLDNPSFLPTDIVDVATINIYAGGFNNTGFVFRWSVSTLNLNTEGTTGPFIGFKLTTDCSIKTINVQAKVFDSEENAVAFVNSLSDEEPQRTLNLDSAMDVGIKNAMKTAAQAKGWTVNETAMSQTQQAAANNIQEPQADNDLQKEFAAVQEELQSDKTVNGTIPGGIFGVAQQSAPDMEYVDMDKEQSQADETTGATPSQEDTQKQE